MQPDAVQAQNKPFECRVILLGAIRFICRSSSYFSDDRAGIQVTVSGRHGLCQDVLMEFAQGKVLPVTLRMLEHERHIFVVLPNPRHRFEVAP